MKFTEWRWRLRKGVDANHPSEVFEVESTDNTLEVFAPVRPIHFCGDTLNNPMISVQLSSPLEGVIRVRVVHFKGGCAAGPVFRLVDETPGVDIIHNKREYVLGSGILSAHVHRTEGWRMEFREAGRRLTESGLKGIGYMVEPDGQAFMKDELDIGVGECIYGLGERFTRLSRMARWLKRGMTTAGHQASGPTRTSRST